jgi:hypothetical protein
MKATSEKFRPGDHDPLTILVEHDKIYARLKAAKAKRNQSDKIDDFMETFTPCGLFQRVIEKFLEENPESEEQNTKFEAAPQNTRYDRSRFPMHAWEDLITHAELTINLLRASNTNTSISA